MRLQFVLPDWSRGRDRFAFVAMRHRSSGGPAPGTTNANRQRPSDLAVPLRVVDLAPGADVEQRALDLATAEACRALSVEEGPLAAFLLIRLGSIQSHIVMNVHHLVSDGASIHILHRDLAAIYTQEALGIPVELPELDCEYGHFAEAQREAIDSGKLAGAQLFWQRELPSDAQALELPLDFCRRPARSYRGAFHTVRLPSELTRACRAMSFRHRVPVSSLLLAGYAALLGRLTGQRRILIGTSFVGRRQRASYRHCVGMFINTVPLYFDLRAAAAWPDVIQIVNRAFTRAYDHQDYPLQLLIEGRPAERDWSKPALFQMAFNFQSARPEDILWGDRLGTCLFADYRVRSRTPCYGSRRLLHGPLRLRRGCLSRAEYRDSGQSLYRHSPGNVGGTHQRRAMVIACRGEL